MVRISDMHNVSSHLDARHDLVSLFEETLRKIHPDLETLTNIAQALNNPVGDNKISSPCNSCPTRNQCSEPCGKLNKLLPSVSAGRRRQENSTGLYEQTLQEVNKNRLTDIFEQYKACKEIFSTKQYEVIYLFYHDGKSKNEIARLLNKTHSTVNGLFKRAEKEKEKHAAGVRHELAEKLKKNEK